MANQQSRINFFNFAADIGMGLYGVEYGQKNKIDGLQSYAFMALAAVLGEFVRAGNGGGGVWGDIVRVGKDKDKLGIEFSSFVRKVGDGSCISFWGDRWVDGVRLMDRFPRLSHLDRCNEGVVADKGRRVEGTWRWVEGTWRWVWDWVREPRGRVVGELEALEQTKSNTNITLNCKDTWKWVLEDSGAFSVKALSDLVEAKCINTGNHNSETTWNNLVPKKVNIFAWRAIRGRFPARVELDKKGIDIHSILCPNYDEMCETMDHSLVLCTEAMKVWEKVFEWWNLQNVNVFSTEEMLRYNGDTTHDVHVTLASQDLDATSPRTSIKCEDLLHQSLIHFAEQTWGLQLCIVTSMQSLVPRVIYAGKASLLTRSTTVRKKKVRAKIT
ncbi:RNA-directed DNA polymerase, eukaryota, reverse transcriptase zinc-binding domain protein [Tanacetum coccineum]